MRDRGRGVGLLRDVAKALAAGRTVGGVLDAAMEALVREIGAHLARVWLVDPDSGDLIVQSTEGSLPEVDQPYWRIPMGTPKIGRIASRRSAEVSNDLRTDDEVTAPEWIRAEGVHAFAGYPLVAGDQLLGVFAVVSQVPFDDHDLEVLSAVADALAIGIRRIAAEDELRAEAAVTQTLFEVGRAIAGTLDLDAVVQVVTDSATKLVHAQFGAFFYNVEDESGESYTLYTISGVAREAFSSFPLPRNTAVFSPTFHGEGVVRLDDVTSDPRYGQSAPYHGMPAGHLPVRSYLAVPVTSAAGGVLGGLFFGHEDVGVFDAHAERLAVGIADQAAAAVESARSFLAEHHLALRLQEALLPVTPTAVQGAEIAVRYLPASVRAEVGGDWYDVSRLADGTVAITIGDVVGHDLHAAVVMGQVRNAVRLHALEGRAPAEVLDLTDRFMGLAGIDDLATVLHGVYDPTSRRLTLARAGHPPPLFVRADGHVEWADIGALHGPMLNLGVPGAERTIVGFDLGFGDSVVLFTDGLVERRGESIEAGFARVEQAAREGAGLDAEHLCSHLVSLSTGHRSDDVAVVVLRVAPEPS